MFGQPVHLDSEQLCEPSEEVPVDPMTHLVNVTL